MESGGFTHLHVNGLPADIEDSTVELELRRALSCATTNDANSVEAGADTTEVSDDAVERKASNDVLTESPVAADQSDEDSVTCSPVAARKLLLGFPEAEEAAEAGSRLEGACEDDGASASGADVHTRESDAVDSNEALLSDEMFVTCNVVRNKDTNACKGYCFLGFSSLGAAEKAMSLLNAGATVAGSGIQAQISVPKERHAKPKDPTECLNDLRLRRQRYQTGSKKQQLGHVTCSDTKARIATKTGKINAVGGTRGGKQQLFENDTKSTRSGFASAK